MKSMIGFRLVLFSLTLLTFASSCKKEKDVTPTIAGVVTTTSEFSTLSAAVSKAGLGATLSGTEIGRAHV